MSVSASSALALVLWAAAVSAAAQPAAVAVQPGATRLAHTPRQPDVGAHRFERLTRWLTILQQHQPGTFDDAASEIRSWSNDDLRTLWVDANLLVRVMRNPSATLSLYDAKGRRTPYAPSDLQRLRDVASTRAKPLSDTFIIYRGALLHTDIAMDEPAMEPLRATRGAPQRVRLDVDDGRAVALGDAAVHWEIARMLLAFAKPGYGGEPNPAQDPFVRQWYRATLTWMELRENDEPDHVAAALGLFPDDPDLLFLAGCLHEAFAAPKIQAAVRAAALPSGYTMAVGAEGAELKEAAQYFRRAVKARGAFPEAHLRLGRVLETTGQAANAVAELRRALESTDEPLLQYYGELFLGAAEESLRHDDLARAAYERAATLYPRAQSPLVALAALARRRGEPDGVRSATSRLFDGGEHVDPWWDYHVTQARQTEALLDELWRPFRGSAPR